MKNCHGDFIATHERPRDRQDWHGFPAHFAGNSLPVLSVPGFGTHSPRWFFDSIPGFASDTLESMTQQPSPKIQLINTSEYRENYANSVQIRVNLWDFFLMFGRVNQTAADNVAIHNFQGVYLSPQQAKALLNILQQNVTQYETAFGEIKLEPHADGGIVQ
jgi:Protein of unknown function (DUF3467)